MMFKRILIGLVSMILVGATVYGCNKGGDTKETPTPATDVATAPAEDVAVPSADAEVPAADTAPAANVEIPAEAKAASDDVFSVMFAIASAGKKESCAEVLAELKKLDNDEVKAKIEHGRYLQTLPADVQRAINEQNRVRMMGVVSELASYQKCENSPERRDIDEILQKIMAPMMPEAAVRDAAAIQADKAGDNVPPAADAASDAPAKDTDAAKDAVNQAIDAAVKDTEAAKDAVNQAIDTAVKDTDAAKAAAAKAIDGAVKDSEEAKAAVNDVIDAAAKDPAAARAAAAKVLDAAAKDPDAAKAALDAAAKDPAAAKAAALEAMKNAQ